VGEKIEFVALDFETANADMSSICQIGLVHFKDGLLKEEWKTYVDPEDFFDEINVSIHGIDDVTVKGSPKFQDIVSHLYGYMDDQIAVCHTHFDRAAMHQACTKHDLRMPTCTWLDSARVVRRTWEQFAYRGYGLANVCDAIGYQFEQHDALEDAKAAAYILLAAIEKTGMDLHKWLQRVERGIGFPYQSGKIVRNGNPEGALYGETLVFTGKLKIPRPMASEMAAKAGCAVDDRVNANTTILVVGDQDIKKLAGHTKSSKHRKAEELIQKGQSMRILIESDFSKLVDLTRLP
jgi:DNA polymerase-3 subunit epsilon